MAYTVGQAEVIVVPNAESFNRDLAAKINPQAKAIGDQIGRQMSQSISDGIRKGLGDWPADGARAQGAKTGSESGGAFADAFKARLKAALASLPDVKLGADSSEADRKLAAIRADLAELSGKTIGVDLSDAEAVAKLDELRARLDRLNAESSSVQVRTDTAKASADLAEFQVKLDRINGETATANVDVDDHGSTAQATSGITSLWGAVAMVSPALVPIAGGAAAAGAALVSMAAAGVGAVGVLAIALASVGNAVKLLGQQQTAQAASDAQAGAQAAARSQAITAAARQEQSAQMSLADARRQAADQQIQDSQAIQQAQYGVAQAAQRVESAQYSLAQADQQEVSAVKALNTAREEAARQLESYANQAKDAQLSERQSVLDLQTAQDNLAKVNSNAASTAQQRAQAELDLEKAQQRVTEAQQSATQAAQDNTKAQKAGVDGAPQVVQAQAAIVQAQHGVAQAAQGLADAQHGQQQAQQQLAGAQRKAAEDQIKSQESITRAQQGVAAAADAMAAAQRQSAATSSAALQDVNAKVAALDPATRAFASYLRTDWLPIWHQVQAAATGGLLPGVQAGLEDLKPVMPGMIDLVHTLASTMGTLFQQGSKALAGPFWQDFIGMVRNTAGPLLSDLVHTLENVGHGFAGILEAFMPMSLTIGDGIVGLTGKFAAWGENLRNSQGFHEFTDYIRAAWPTIKEIAENLATAAGHLVQALAGLGSPMLTTLKIFSSVLAGLPVPVVEALVVAFAGFKIFQTIAGPFQAFTKSLDSFASKADAAAASGSRLGSAARGLSNSLPLIGTAATLAMAPFAQIQQDQDNITSGIGRMYDAIRKGGPGAGQAAAELADFTAKAKAHDSEWYNQLFGNKWMDAVNKAKQSNDQIVQSMGPIGAAEQDVTEKTNALAKAIQDYGPNSKQAKDASDAYAAAQENLAGKQQQVANATKTASDAVYGLINAELAQANADVGAAIAMDQTTKAIDDFKNGTDKSKTAQDQIAQSILTAVAAAGKQAEQDNLGLSPAEQHKKAVDAQRDAFDQLVKQLGYVPPALQHLNDSLHNNMNQADLTSTAMSGLGLTVIGLPTSHYIEIKAPTAEQEAALKQLGYDTIHLPNGNVVVVANTDPAKQTIEGFFNAMGAISTTLGNFHIFGGNHADGGLLRGPGSGTSDSMLIGASNGEFVVKANQTAKHLPLLQAINSDALPKYAQGGLVGSILPQLGAGFLNYMQFAVNATIDSPSATGALAASVAPSSGGVERWRADVDQVLRMLGIALSADNGVLQLIAHESGGNPNAINLTDSNARAGHPSQGLMQTIPSTFAAYRSPLLPNNILDPLANIYAGVNYALKRYGVGMLAGGGRHNASGAYIGYDQGGTLDPGYHQIYNGTGQTEIVAPRQTFEQVMSGASGGGASDLAGLRIVGTLDLGNGLEGRIDGRIAGALDTMANRMAYNP